MAAAPPVTGGPQETLVSLFARNFAATTALVTVIVRMRIGGDEEPAVRGFSKTRVNFQTFTWTYVGTGTRAEQTVSAEPEIEYPVPKGEIIGLVATIAAGVKRGENYNAIYLRERGVNVQKLCAGYIYDGHDLTLGEFVEPGPGSGDGALLTETIATDAAGNVTTTYDPVLTNAKRILYGIVVYYNADGNAASRIPRIVFRRPYGALPTGFATAGASDVQSIAGPTLIASEEGTLFIMAGPGGYPILMNNDNGTVSTLALNAPLPYLLNENDPILIRISADAGLAGDVYSAYALIEEWVVP